jgi:archaellum component FlaF (FlaF/FlaG flagellin family)
MNKFETLSHFVLTQADNEELNTLIEYIKMRRLQITKSTVRSISKGAKVTFTGRTGTVYNGTVVDVKIKNLVVETQLGRYRVPASMVKIVQEA